MFVFLYVGICLINGVFFENCNIFLINIVIKILFFNFDILGFYLDFLVIILI